MRVIFTLITLIVVLGWLGYELKDKNRDVASVLMGFAGVLAIMLIAAFFGLA